MQVQKFSYVTFACYNIKLVPPRQPFPFRFEYNIIYICIHWQFPRFLVVKIPRVYQRLIVNFLLQAEQLRTEKSGVLGAEYRATHKFKDEILALETSLVFAEWCN
jgi:hypothetical protein